jgi:tetratricopeptide (TPR) repeat protein
LFRQVVTQEVTYQSMPFALRSNLHERVAAYVEASDVDMVDRHLDLLAHHYWNSANLPKKREYLRRAGDAAQGSYANLAAIDYFDRLVPLVEAGERVDVLLKLGKVRELVGDWRGAKDVDSDALRLAESIADEHLRALAETALAEVARKEGRYSESTELLDRARRRFDSLGDQAGVARVLHLNGTLAAQRGEYPSAVESYEASLRIREQAGDKASMGSLLSNLGIVAEYQGDYPASHAFHERALALRTQIGDRWAISISTNNLGMIALAQERYEEARAWFEKAIALGREVGDTWVVAVCKSNLANAARGLADYATARRYYAECLRAYRNYDDRWSIAFLLEDIAVLTACEGNGSAALELMGAADAARSAIGAPRSPSLAAEIEKKLRRSIVTLSEQDRSECRARGASVDLAAAMDSALALCASDGVARLASGQ